MDRRLLVNILIVGMFALAAIGFKAQASAEFKIVEEWKFEKEIKDVRFGETEDGRMYPKIVVFEDEIRLYDKDFKKTMELNFVRGTMVYFSPKNYYFGAITDIQKPNIEKGNSRVIFTLYDEYGQKKAGTDYEVGYDGEGSRISFISDSGNFVQADASSHNLWFYDINGKLKQKVDLFRDDEWSYERGIFGSFLEDGNRLAVFACKEFIQSVKFKERFEEPNLYVIVFDNDEKELWRRPIEEHAPTSLLVSSEGKYIAVAAENRGGILGVISQFQYLFDRSGNLTGKYSAGRICKFSEDEKYLLIAGKNTVELIQTSTGKVSWAKKFSWSTDSREKEWKWIENVEISGDGSFVILISNSYRRRTGGYDVVESELILLNKDGEIVGRKRLEGRNILAKMNHKGTEIFIRKQNTVEKFEQIQ